MTVVAVGAHRLCTNVVPTPADSVCRLCGTISATAIEVTTHCAIRVVASTAEVVPTGSAALTVVSLL